MHKIFIILVAAIAFAAASCVVVENTCPQANQTGQVELFSNDVVSLIDDSKILSTQVTVDGIKLGDTFTHIVDVLGAPAIIDEYYDDGVLNAKYENAQGQATYIFHIENDTVSRIVIREGLNDRLPEGSKVDMTLEEITARFGKPDRSEDISYGSGGYRVYYYNSLGFEIYHQRKKMIGYGFVAPQVAAPPKVESIL